MKYITACWIVLMCMGSLMFCYGLEAATEDELFGQGVALLKEDKAKEAVNTFSRLIDILPGSPDAYRNRGVGYMKLSQYDLAIKDFETAMALKPDLKDLYSNIGVAWYYKKKFNKAIEFYNKELELRPENHFAYFNRAICWAALDDYEKGIQDTQKSLALFSDNYLALCLQGDLFDKAGRHDQAGQAYEKAIALTSDHDYAKRKLAGLNQRLNQKVQVSEDAKEKSSASKDSQDKDSQDKDSQYKDPEKKPSAPKPIKESAGGIAGETAAEAGVNAAVSSHDPKPVPEKAHTDTPGSPGTPDTLAHDPLTTPRFEVQIGAFLGKGNAEKLLKKLVQKKYPARILSLTGKRGRQWYLVRVGDYADTGSASKARAGVNADMNVKAVIRPWGSF